MCTRGIVSKLWSLIQWAVITAAAVGIFSLSVVSYMSYICNVTTDMRLCVFGGFVSHPVILIMHNCSLMLHNCTSDFAFVKLFAFHVKPYIIVKTLYRSFCCFLRIVPIFITVNTQAIQCPLLSITVKHDLYRPVVLNQGLCTVPRGPQDGIK